MHFQWYPGHMTKTRRQMQEDIALVDVVIELIDARIPYSSQNPEIRKLCADKPSIILLNKASLADPNITKAFVAKYTTDTTVCIETDCINGFGLQKIAPAIEYISQHYNEKITNDVLAAVVGMSTVYFRKLFASAMGVSPITYANNLRIEKAKEMLKSDYGSLSDIAISLGYPSLYDFSRAFKKHTGISPSKYESQ